MRDGWLRALRDWCMCLCVRVYGRSVVARGIHDCWVLARVDLERRRAPRRLALALALAERLPVATWSGLWCAGGAPSGFE